jgi:hypothetical protein
MALIENVGEELKTRLTNLYDATIVTIAALMEKHLLKTGEREIDLCERACSIATVTDDHHNPESDNPYRKVSIEIVGINDEGQPYLVINDYFGENEIIGREELAEEFYLDALVAVAEELDKVVER